MNTLSDWELIRVFAEKQSNEAFAELVRRHLGLVYASALRQVRSPDLASDVAQAVFLLLARKASSLPSKVVLSGWLFRSTRFVAARMTRDEDLRHRREQEAAEMNQSTSTPDNELWHAVEPHLDDALAALGEKDRQAVLLRFLEGKRIREVGELLGLGEDAAKKRVNRAIEKLRSALGRRGVAVPALTLAGVLAGAQAHAAPAGLAQTLGATMTMGSAKASIVTLVAGAARDWAWHQTRRLVTYIAPVAALVILAGFLQLANHAMVPDSVAQTPTSVAKSQLLTSSSPAQPIPSTATPTANTGGKFLLTVFDKVSGEPIAGVFVLNEIFTGSAPRSTEYFTGPDGTCVLEIPGAPFYQFSLWLSASNHVPISMTWFDYEIKGSESFHTVRLDPGIVMQGRVVDEKGQPVAGAHVDFGSMMFDTAARERVSYKYPYNSVVTDADGHYQTSQAPDSNGGVTSVAVVHTDFLPTQFGIASRADIVSNRTIVLHPGVPVRGLVVDAQDNPIGGAELKSAIYRAEPVIKTAADGTFEISQVNASSPVWERWEVEAEGYAPKGVSIGVNRNDPEIKVTLKARKSHSPSMPKPRTHLLGTVVDDKTGNAVASFKVLQVTDRSDRRLLGEGANGQFDWNVDLAPRPPYSVAVEAEGYLPEISPQFGTDETEPTFVFKMKRGKNLSGVLLQADGQPAARAIVGLVAPAKKPLWAFRDNAQLDAFQKLWLRVYTDESGRFSFPCAEEVNQLVAVHETGYVCVAADSVTNINVLLKPWGKVEGVFRTGKSPKEGERILVSDPAEPAIDRAIQTLCTATTDMQGRFRFPNLLPGTYTIARSAGFGLVLSTQKKTIQVVSGQTVHVDIGGDGRAVVGKLALSSPLPDYNWNSDAQALVIPQPNLPQPQRKDFNSDQDFFLAVMDRESRMTKFYLVIQPDGSFRVNDVPPGTYELQLHINRTPLGYSSGPILIDSRAARGLLTSSVTIPEADSKSPEATVDLGTFTIPLAPK